MKLHVFKELASQIGRTHKSVELKFQNISAVLDELGLQWISGLAPMRNFQRILSDIIEEKLDELVWKEDAKEFIQPVGLSEASGTFDGFTTTIDYEAAPQKADKEAALPDHMQLLARKFDPVVRDLKNRSLGEAGEKRIFENERAKLVNSGRPDLAEKVEWTSRVRGDGAGYDILSFYESGKARFLEVKTTNGWQETPFFMSKNELDFAGQSKENYSIIRLYDFNRNQRAFEIQNPIQEKLNVIPDHFRMTFR